MASMSRWFVGSSSSSRSGSATSARASSTRRFMPDESVSNAASPASSISRQHPLDALLGLPGQVVIVARRRQSAARRLR